MSENKFDRGTALTIFGSDRHEDLMALVISLLIALLVYLFICFFFEPIAGCSARSAGFLWPFVHARFFKHPLGQPRHPGRASR